MFYKGDRVYVKEFGSQGTVNFTIAHSEPTEDRSEVTLDTPTYYGNPPKPMWTLMFFCSDLQSMKVDLQSMKVDLQSMKVDLK